MKKAISLLLIAALVPFMAGCPTVDEVMNGLQIADNVARAAQPIIQPVNPQAADLLTKISSDMELIIETYKDYETAAGDKPGKAQLIQATAGAIQGNLRSLLAAVGAKNPQLIQYVSIAVAIVNSAIKVVLSKLPPATVVQSAEVGGKLPMVDGAKTAKDLKDAWNNAVRKAYPNSRI